MFVSSRNRRRIDTLISSIEGSFWLRSAQYFVARQSTISGNATEYAFASSMVSEQCGEDRSSS